VGSDELSSQRIAIGHRTKVARIKVPNLHQWIGLLEKDFGTNVV